MQTYSKTQLHILRGIFHSFCLLFDLDGATFELFYLTLNGAPVARCCCESDPDGFRSLCTIVVSLIELVLWKYHKQVMRFLCSYGGLQVNPSADVFREFLTTNSSRFFTLSLMPWLKIQLENRIKRLSLQFLCVDPFQ